MAKLRPVILTDIILNIGTRYRASEDIEVSGTLYMGSLMNSPSLSSELSDIYGQQRWSSEITLEYSNADGSFTTLFAAEDFRNKPVKVQMYEATAGTTTFIMRGIINSVKIGDTLTITVALQDPNPLQIVLPQRVLTNDDFASDRATASYRPAIDLGKPYNICLGYCSKVPLLALYWNTSGNTWDYLIGYGTIETNNTNKASTCTVYRDKVVVDSSEYTVYDGSQGSPYAGYAFIRFTAEQIDFNSKPYELTMDLRGLEMGTSAAERNPVLQIQNLLNNSTYGLSQSVNAASFTTASTATMTNTSVTMASFKSDGAISSQTKAIDVIQCLLQICRGKSLVKNSSGEYVITVDSYVASPSAAAYFGDGDGYYENIVSMEPKEYESISNAVKSIAVNYRLNPWTNEYASQNKRTVLSFGEDVIIDNPFLRDDNTADYLTCLMKNRLTTGDEKISLVVGSEAKSLTEGSIISVNVPRASFNINTTYRVLDWTPAHAEMRYRMVCEKYSSSFYTYSAGSVPSAPNDDSQADFSSTAPDAPTSLTVVAWTSGVGSDGGSYAGVTISAVAPTTNFSNMLFGVRKHDDTAYSYVRGMVYSGTTWRAGFTNLTPGLYYDFTAKSINIWSLESTGNPENTPDDGTPSDNLAPGDTTAPGTPSMSSASTSIRGIQLKWTLGSEADIARYDVYRNTSNTSVGASLVGSVGRTDNYLQTSGTYGQMYYFFLKAIDFTGNASGFSTATNNSATFTRTQTSDLEDGCVTAIKTNNLTANNITAGVLYIQNGSVVTSSYGGDKYLTRDGAAYWYTTGGSQLARIGLTSYGGKTFVAQFGDGSNVNSGVLGIGTATGEGVYGTGRDGVSGYASSSGGVGTRGVGGVSGSIGMYADGYSASDEALRIGLGYVKTAYTPLLIKDSVGTTMVTIDSYGAHGTRLSKIRTTSSASWPTYDLLDDGEIMVWNRTGAPKPWRLYVRLSTTLFYTELS